MRILESPDDRLLGFGDWVRCENEFGMGLVITPSVFTACNIVDVLRNDSVGKIFYMP